MSKVKKVEPMKGDLAKAILNQVVRINHKGSRQNVRKSKEQISHRMSKRLILIIFSNLNKTTKPDWNFYAGILKMVKN